MFRCSGSIQWVITYYCYYIQSLFNSYEFARLLNSGALLGPWAWSMAQLCWTRSSAFSIIHVKGCFPCLFSTTSLGTNWNFICGTFEYLSVLYCDYLKNCNFCF